MPAPNPSNDSDPSETGSPEHSVNSIIDLVINSISNTEFKGWYHEKQFAQNILEGKSYFNGPSPPKEPEHHTPSKLLVCQRKASYARQNAPREGTPPQGLFWVGSELEEEVIVPFLRDAVTTDETYVTNSVWVDYEIPVDGDSLRVRGSTDPAIVTSDADPILVSEVKSTTSLDHLEGPKLHHKAQLTAYLYGLDEEFDRSVTDGVVVYVSRKTLEIETFHVTLDPAFWRSVVEWMTRLTKYEQAGELPPASPEQSWECKYCDFKHRCGEGESPFSDVGYDGLLPLFDGYDRQNLEEYLQAHEERDARLTPSLAHKHPDLVERYGAYDWSCVACGATYEWDAVDWDGDVDDPPFCPACIEAGDMVVLSGPEPDEQLST